MIPLVCWIFEKHENSKPNKFTLERSNEYYFLYVNGVGSLFLFPNVVSAKDWLEKHREDSWCVVNGDACIFIENINKGKEKFFIVKHDHEFYRLYSEGIFGGISRTSEFSVEKCREYADILTREREVIDL